MTTNTTEGTNTHYLFK